MDSDVKNAKAIFPYEEALAKTKEYFKDDELAASVWINKYAMKDSFGNLYECTPKDMHQRLAAEFARIEKKYPNPMSQEEIFHLLDHFKYVIPQGGPMSGIGNDHQIASLSNCFVIGHERPADSYGGILKIDEEQVQLMKRRGGVGHDLSHIRPGGSPVLNSALTSTGVVPFMERYSNSTREVAQDGRRGALMLSISIKHPDAEQFIDAKLEQNKVTGANVSVKIDDDFMKAALSGKPYTQQYPTDAVTPRYKKEIDAAALWKKIICNAWKSAEPGVLFWDTILRESVADCYADLGYKTVSTNPCGEIPLCPYDSCRLIAINLFSYVDRPFTPEARFNVTLFKNHVMKAMRLNDDLVDLEMEKIERIIDKLDKDPEDEVIKRTERELWLKIKEKTLGGRRTGLGITAEGDMLAALGLRYGSEEAIQVGVQVQKTLALAAYRSSVIMAQERGPFPIYDANRELRNPMIERIRQEDEELYKQMIKTGRRNISMLTIAPTGTTSLMTQTTSGIEQVFMPVYQRRKKVNPNDKNVNVSFTDKLGDAFEEYNVFHHKFLDWAEINGYDRKRVMQMSKEDLQKLVEESPYYKATSNDVDWVAKVKMQGQLQKWVDHSISVTVNLPSDISEEMVAKVYKTAWEWGCKGITVYRDGSRTGVLVSADSPEKGGKMMKSMPKERPVELEAEVIRFKNANEQWIAFVGLYEGRPYEIFTGKLDEDTRVVPKSITMGKVIKVVEPKGSRYDFSFIDKYGYPNTVGGISHMFNQAYWNYAKLISGVLRNGLPVEEVVHLVSSLELDSQTINNWRTGVERALKRYIPNGTKDSSGTECEKCGERNLVYQEGCLLCMSCGYSKCS
ncbi:MAG TPA: adenosylcobalamin-dependent ribonucleoside-diphosphate reductase [Bacteroidales bacterium]|nr:adenosylcobalamin-dependent ribonucleoside-diphosphate reductase [Bacteroidales bacterium]HOQ95421.1 adenosylcobalamin-dependent ribonucleoside-diphosphate reductase [Bacteroidales bacterium]HPL84219.1 adenosylcobalamin-dependent ribonucleoside-diphosphate reductase [Bacteroidales bacterium]